MISSPCLSGNARSHILGNARGLNRGNVVLLLLVVTFVVMLIASTVANQYVSLENDAIERHIAEVRANLAMIGTLDYMTSRLRNDGRAPLADIDDSAKITALNTALGEINDRVTIPGLWLYDAAATGTNDYTYDVAATIADLDNIDDGRLQITLSINTPDAQVVPVLKGLPNRLGSLVITLCAGDTTTSGRSAAGACETIGGADPNAENGITTILSVDPVL